MGTYVFVWDELGYAAKKITGLALIPALVCCLMFGLLIWVTSGTTAGLVGGELTRFMA